MAKSVFDAPQFKTEAAAFAYVEAALWPNGPVCPHCGEDKRVGRMAGKTTRAGLCKCYACRKPFTVRMGTIFESSHLALHLWLQVIHLMCASKKGISTRQIQRMLSCSMKTAWFLGHRIREAMAPGKDAGPIGGEGKIVEADETYLGKSVKTRRKPGQPRPQAVLSLVQRDGGPIRSMPLANNPSRYEILNALRDNVHPASALHTDGAYFYKFLPRDVISGQESVDHNKTYVRKTEAGVKVHTNTLEGFFSVFKRGLVGVYQHMDEKHLHRYLAEFDFRANTREKLGVNDVSRASIALKGFKGKRLTYQTAH
jgi:transposase-like protein